MTKIQARGGWFMDTKAHPTVTPPTRERVEPVGFMNVYHEDGDKAFYGSLHSARKNTDYSVAETAVPLYRHPATIDDAIALLVREGAVDATVNSWHCANGHATSSHGVKALILPTPERAS